MTSNCPPGVEGQLLEVPGVKSCEVSFDAMTATVTAKKGTDPEAVAAGLSGKFSGTVQ